MMYYKVNLKTKVHRRDDGVKTDDEVWLEADESGWVAWPGGDCPLPEKSFCDYRFFDGTVIKNIKACEIAWQPKPKGMGKTAYRPILDADTKVTHPGTLEGPDKWRASGGEWSEPPAWDGEGLPPVGCECECTFAVEDHDTWHRGVVTLRGVAPEGHEIVAIKVGDITAVYRSAKHIRPIRSEEDRAVEAIEAAYRKGCGVNSEGSFTSIYAAIRDGKVPGVRLDD